MSQGLCQSVLKCIWYQILGIIGLTKGLINCGPQTVMFVIPNTLIAILLLPHDIYFTYYTILKTEFIGKNLKSLAMLLLPFPLISWPPFVLASSLIYSVLYSIFFQVYITIDKWEEQGILISGQQKSYSHIIQSVKKVFEFNSNSYFVYLKEYRTNHCNDPFDISFLQLLMALLISIHGIIVCSISGSFLSILYLIPTYLKFQKFCIEQYFSYECNKKIMLSPLFIISFALCPLIAALTSVIVICYFIYKGVESASVGYKEGFIKGIKIAYTYVQELNSSYIDFLKKN